MILILTGAEDLHADWLEKKLRERNADFIRFDPADFPTKTKISLSYLPDNQIQYILHIGETSIDLSSIKTVWYRRPQRPHPHTEGLDKSAHQFLIEECESFVQDVWNFLDCLWLPAQPITLQRAKSKALQLKIAAEIGFDLPPTLMTNNPQDFIDFYNQNNGQVISKLAGPSLLRNLRDDFTRFTEFVSKRDVIYAQSVQRCPAIFQAYVPKQVELRITVVGHQVLAAEIHSQKSNHTRYDWRHYDYHKTPYYPHELPQAVSQLCIQLVQKLGLCYGTIDMIVTPDGQYIFLEINPNGQYLWIEQATGLPISDAICDLLISGNREQGTG
ncbi:MAG: hypothetical protein KME21_17950 [Desmonostoc vinosum HA7617-LM4]|jgi:hypothetical protein|nr:hypothetical protein [Desmonostoc vinosum HA7617-LM4]